MKRLTENEVNDLCRKLEDGEVIEQGELLALMDSFIVEKAREGIATQLRQGSRRKH